MADALAVFKTLCGWLEAELMESRLMLRAPSGVIVGDFPSLTDVPRVAVDPSTGTEFRVHLEQIEVWYRMSLRLGAAIRTELEKKG